jgi:outer membrane protein
MIKRIVLFTLLLIPVGTFAQEIKIAYLNSAEVITAMPEYIQMQDSVQKMTNAIQAELKTMEEEYALKYEALMRESDTLVESIRVKRLQEIQDIEQRANTFQQQQQQQLQQLQESLFTPIQEKLKNAVDAVGVENNFTYIFNAAPNLLLYVNPTSSIDATPLVKKKLGLK